MTEDTAKDQARAQYESLCSMVNALGVDYDRLDELNKIVAEHTKKDTTCKIELLREWEELLSAADKCENQDAARDRIQEDPLSVLVRSGWYNPGDYDGQPPSEDFELLLMTGGPAVRIIGELDEFCQPVRAWLEYQDWGISWQRYFEVDENTLLTYCREFYLGE